MKKKVAAILTCVTVCASLLAGCASSTTTESTGSDTTTATTEESSNQEEVATEAVDTITGAFALDASWPEETLVIGVETYDTADGQFLALQEYFESLKESFNISFMYSESLKSAEDELNFINSCAAAGAKAIIGYYNIAGAEAIQETIDQGMYYWGTEQYYDQFAENDLYLGCYTFIEDGEAQDGDYLAGYELGYNLGKQGVKKTFYCNGGAGLGVPMFINRQAGFEAGIAAAQAEGAQIEFDPGKDIVAGWPGTDDFTAAVGAKLAEDYDGVGVSFNAAALFQPIADAGKSESIHMAAIGQVSDMYYDAVQSGQISVMVYDCEEVVFGSSITSILNAVAGNLEATRGADNKALKALVSRWTVADMDTYNAVYAFHDDGNYFVSVEDLANCLVAYNPEATSADLIKTYGSLDLETALTIAQ